MINNKLIEVVVSVPQISLFGTNKDPFLILRLLAKTRPDWFSLDDIFDGFTDEACTSGDEDDGRGRHSDDFEGFGMGDGRGWTWMKAGFKYDMRERKALVSSRPA